MNSCNAFRAALYPGTEDAICDQALGCSHNADRFSTIYIRLITEKFLRLQKLFP
ncbi:hypothetical protein H6F96_19465 [Microcoleus sp. FACHB-53]|nr:hypothetical protein [Microcoleus sp. FACHB-53]